MRPWWAFLGPERVEGEGEVMARSVSIFFVWPEM